MASAYFSSHFGLVLLTLSIGLLMMAPNFGIGEFELIPDLIYDILKFKIKALECYHEVDGSARNETIQCPAPDVYKYCGTLHCQKLLG
jgi:hypothetical protein